MTVVTRTQIDQDDSIYDSLLYNPSVISFSFLNHHNTLSALFNGTFLSAPHSLDAQLLPSLGSAVVPFPSDTVLVGWFWVLVKGSDLGHS